MAKSTMNKVSKKVAKMDKSTLAIILVSLALVIVVTVILVRKSKREGFALMDLSNASFVTQGADGAPGADGAQGVDGAPGADGDDYIPSDQDRNNIYSDFKEKDLAENSRLQTELYNSFKNKLMGEMVQNKLIVKEDDKYFPVGVIGMKTSVDTERNIIDIGDLNGDVKHFKVKYNKKAKNSYVKITYTITLTGHNNEGNQFRVYSSKDNFNQISATHSHAGVWEGSYQKIVPKSSVVIGIDRSNEIGERDYYCKIDCAEGAGYSNNRGRIVINAMEWNTDHNDQHWKTDKYEKQGYLSSSCTIEEIMTGPLDEGETSNLGDFVNN